MVARAGVARERHVGERQVEAGRVGHEPQVAGEGEAGSRAGGDAVDRRDHRLGHAGERGHDRVVVVLDGREELVAAAVVQQLDVLLEVLAGAERAAGAGEHHAARRGVVGHLPDDLEQQHLGRHVEAVHRLGPVERDGGDAVGDVEQYGCGHGASLSGETAVDEAVRPGQQPRGLAGEPTGRLVAGPVGRQQLGRAAPGRRTGTSATRARGGSAPRTPPRPARRAGRCVRRPAAAEVASQPSYAARSAGRSQAFVGSGSGSSIRAVRAVASLALQHRGQLDASERADPDVVGQLGVAEVGQVGAQPGPAAAVGRRRDDGEVPGRRPSQARGADRSGRRPRRAAAGPGRSRGSRVRTRRSSAPASPARPSARWRCAPPARRCRPAPAAARSRRPEPRCRGCAGGRRRGRKGPTAHACGECAIRFARFGVSPEPDHWCGPRHRWGIMARAV